MHTQSLDARSHECGVTDRTGESADSHVLPAGAGSAALLFPDINGNLRGKLVVPSELESESARTVGLPTTDLLLAVDPVDEPITTLTDIGITAGSKDLLLKPDTASVRRMPWLNDDAYLVLGDLNNTDGSTCEVSPRGVLRRALTALSECGLQIMAAFEFEFRLFRADSWEPATSGLSYSMAPLAQVADFVATFRSYAEAMRLGLSVVHSEGAPGLIEVNVDPAVGLDAADIAALLRTAATEAARRHDLRACFMSKPIAREEGSSAHVHFSFWNEGGDNALRGAVDDAHDEFYRRCASGIVQHLPAMSVIYNPTINSFKRLVPGYFAPVTAGCGPDDRSFALRALLRGPRSSRFELRRPGADCNPYLTLAAIAASAYLGLVDTVVPARDELDRHDAPLPNSLESAVSEFRRRDSRLDDVLGARFCRHYLHTREWELHAWQDAVSEWERQRYA